MQIIDLPSTARILKATRVGAEPAADDAEYVIVERVDYDEMVTALLLAELEPSA